LVLNENIPLLTIIYLKNSKIRYVVKKYNYFVKNLQNKFIIPMDDTEKNR